MVLRRGVAQVLDEGKGGSRRWPRRASFDSFFLAISA
jgi:hypothetical protein